MKKNLQLLVALMMVSVFAFGQSADKQITISKLDHQAVKQSTSKATAQINRAALNGMEKRDGVQTSTTNFTKDPQADFVGTSTYDLQSNSATCRRLHYGSDGTLHASWTMSFADDGAYADRGTGYNNNASGSWGPAPTERLEGTNRTGWSNIVSFSDGTVGIVAHSGGGLVFTKKIGFGWQSAAVPQTAAEDPTWPRVSQQGDIINVICTNFEDGVDNGSALMFNRSEDQGDTWQGFNAIQEVYDHYPFYPPGSGAANRTVGGDSYAMDAEGDVIAFVMGDYGMQTVLFKSTDAGASWESTVISSTTDPFELDPSQFEDTWCAGDLSLVLDDD